MHKLVRLTGLLAAVALIGAACSSTPGASSNLTRVRFQLQWVPQAQFAGYYAAQDQGYFREEGLDVQLLAGGPDVNNLQVVASDGAEIGTSWIPKTLQSREGGTDLVTIAPILQRSGTRMIARAGSGITDPASMLGKKIGSWLGGNEPELYAAIVKAGGDPTTENIIKQDFNMSAFIAGDIDVAQAMIYNEYAQVFETKDPDTGELFKPEQMTVIDFNDPSIGTAMLQDAIIARDSWLKKPGNEDIAVKFLKASFRGWIFCRDNYQKCADLVVAAGSELKRGHQTWMMNEMNGLIWPSPNGIGQFDQAAWDNTIDIALTYDVLKAAPADGAYRKDLTEKALAALGTSVDTKGANFQKATVTLVEGGN